MVLCCILSIIFSIQHFSFITTSSPFLILSPIIWLALSYNIDQLTPTYSQQLINMLYGAITGLFLSGTLSIVHATSPLLIISASYTTLLATSSCLVYLLIDKHIFRDKLSIYQKNIWAGATKTLGATIWISLGIIAFSKITNTPVLLFIDGLLGALWITGVLLHNMHEIISGDTLHESANIYARRLFLGVVNLFLDVCKMYLAAKNKSNQHNNQDQQIIKTILGLTGCAYTVYLMISDSFLKPRSSEQLRENDANTYFNSSHNLMEETHLAPNSPVIYNT